jgi:hypothetical protein
MTERPQPPPPADDEEARFDDEGSAIGHPEPNESEPTNQQPRTGADRSEKADEE